MAGKGSWFFEGYKGVIETDDNGTKGRRKLIYTGEYYGFRGGRQELILMKKVCLSLTLLSLIAFFYAQFFPSTGGMVHWLAIPSLLALVPVIFMIMGLINFLPSKDKWEIRVYYAGYRRILRWSYIYLTLDVIWLIMEIIFIILHLSMIADEIRFALAILASVVAISVQIRLMREHEVMVVEGPEIK